MQLNNPFNTDKFIFEEEEKEDFTVNKQKGKVNCQLSESHTHRGLASTASNGSSDCTKSHRYLSRQQVGSDASPLHIAAGWRASEVLMVV